MIKTTIRRENRLKNHLRELKKEDIISQLDRELSPISSRPGILYGLPKMHRKTPH